MLLPVGIPQNRGVGQSRLVIGKIQSIGTNLFQAGDWYFQAGIDLEAVSGELAATGQKSDQK